VEFFSHLKEIIFCNQNNLRLEFKTVKLLINEKNVNHFLGFRIPHYQQFLKASLIMPALIENSRKKAVKLAELLVYTSPG
jgi:hypothetical protein